MKDYFQGRKENWKESFKQKLQKNTDVNKAMCDLINEYVYFSENIKEIKSRIRKILGWIENQLLSMPATRKELSTEKLNEIKSLLENTRKKLR